VLQFISVNINFVFFFQFKEDDEKYGVKISPLWTGPPSWIHIESGSTDSELKWRRNSELKWRRNKTRALWKQIRALWKEALALRRKETRALLRKDTGAPLRKEKRALLRKKTRALLRRKAYALQKEISALLRKRAIASDARLAQQRVDNILIPGSTSRATALASNQMQAVFFPCLPTQETTLTLNYVPEAIGTGRRLVVSNSPRALLEKPLALLEEPLALLDEPPALLDGPCPRLRERHALLLEQQNALVQEICALLEQRDTLLLEQPHELWAQQYALLEKSHALLEESYALLREQHALLEQPHTLLEEQHALLEESHELLQAQSESLEPAGKWVIISDAQHAQWQDDAILFPSRTSQVTALSSNQSSSHPLLIQRPPRPMQIIPDPVAVSCTCGCMEEASNGAHSNILQQPTEDWHYGFYDPETDLDVADLSAYHQSSKWSYAGNFHSTMPSLVGDSSLDDLTSFGWTSHLYATTPAAQSYPSSVINSRITATRLSSPEQGKYTEDIFRKGSKAESVEYENLYQNLAGYYPEYIQGASSLC